MTIPWSVENLRLSIFSNSAVKVDDADWSKLTGETDDSATRTPIPGGGRIFSGDVGGKCFNVSGSANRIDVVITKAAPEAGTEPALPTIGPWEEIKDEFLATTLRWMEQKELPVIRIAFGAVCLAPADNQKSAVATLKQFVKSVSITDTMEELTFSVNKPCLSNVVKDLRLNRLARWSTLLLQFKLLQLSSPLPSDLTEDLHAARLELDYNTDPRHTKPYSSRDLAALYKELTQLASVVVRDGEQP